MAKFTLSNHARTVITERAINAEWIDRIIANPEKTEADGKDSKLRHAIGRISENGDRVLRVVYNGSVEPVRVVTAYFDRALRNKL